MREAIVVQIAGGFAGVRIGELAVAIVGERHVAAAAIVELFDALDVIADGIAVLDTDES